MPGLGLPALGALLRSGAVRPVRPDRLPGVALALAAWGVGPAGGYAANARRTPSAVALTDALGPLTFAALDTRTTALAAGLADLGYGPGDAIGVLHRNDRGFVEAVCAIDKAGAGAVLLNTGLGPAPLAAIARAERLAACFAAPDLAGGLPPWLPVLPPSPAGSARLRPTRRPARIVLLTSGTTGAPKGAERGVPGNLDAVAGLLEALPLRPGEPTVMAAPLFHAWGYSQWLISLLLGSSLVLPGRFDPAAVLAEVERHRATALVAVPVMLQRILDLPAEVRRRHDTSSLRAVVVSGSALAPSVATRFADEFGEVLHNVYGSTEVAFATVAGPAELRRSPGTVGRPLRGTAVSLLSRSGSAVSSGVGRIFVGSGMVFGGYTGGGSRETRGGLMATGDLGRWDGAGLLHVVGREDDMIVSGGENAFPGPVEEAIGSLPEVADVAVVGVPDAEFGQRFRAFVVPAPGATVDPERVRAHVRTAVARHAVPRDVVVVAELPRNATGKVVRGALS